MKTITHDEWNDYFLQQNPYTHFDVPCRQCNDYMTVEEMNQIDFDATFPVIHMTPETLAWNGLWVRIWQGTCPECGEIHQAWVWGYLRDPLRHYR